MIYNIKISGYEDLLQIDDVGDVIKTKWEGFIRTRKDEVIEISGWTGKLSDVKSFRKVGVSSTSKPDVSHIEYMKERQKSIYLPPIDRAKRMGFFRLVYWCFTGQSSEEVKIGDTPIEEHAEKIQLKFFSENPKRVVCDPILYEPIIKSRRGNPFAVSTIEQIVRQDKFAEVKLSTTA